MNQHTWGILLCSLCHSKHRHDQKEKLSKVERRFVLQKDTNIHRTNDLWLLSPCHGYLGFFLSLLSLYFIFYSPLDCHGKLFDLNNCKICVAFMIPFEREIDTSICHFKSGFVRLQQQRLINFLDKIVTK